MAAEVKNLSFCHRLNVLLRFSSSSFQLLLHPPQQTSSEAPLFASRRTDYLLRHPQHPSRESPRSTSKGFQPKQLLQPPEQQNCCRLPVYAWHTVGHLSFPPSSSSWFAILADCRIPQHYLSSDSGQGVTVGSGRPAWAPHLPISHIHSLPFCKQPRALLTTRLVTLRVHAPCDARRNPNHQLAGRSVSEEVRLRQRAVAGGQLWCRGAGREFGSTAAGGMKQQRSVQQRPGQPGQQKKKGRLPEAQEDDRALVALLAEEFQNETFLLRQLPKLRPPHPFVEVKAAQAGALQLISSTLQFDPPVSPSSQQRWKHTPASKQQQPQQQAKHRGPTANHIPLAGSEGGGPCVTQGRESSSSRSRRKKGSGSGILLERVTLITSTDFASDEESLMPHFLPPGGKGAEGQGPGRTKRAEADTGIPRQAKQHLPSRGGEGGRALGRERDGARFPSRSEHREEGAWLTGARKDRRSAGPSAAGNRGEEKFEDEEDDMSFANDILSAGAQGEVEGSGGVAVLPVRVIIRRPNAERVLGFSSLVFDCVLGGEEGTQWAVLQVSIQSDDAPDVGSRELYLKPRRRSLRLLQPPMQAALVKFLEAKGCTAQTAAWLRKRLLQLRQHNRVDWLKSVIHRLGRAEEIEDLKKRREEINRMPRLQAMLADMLQR